VPYVRRDRGTVDAEYQSAFKSEAWEVVVPEFVYDSATAARTSAIA
jgi:hypothetical protein